MGFLSSPLYLKREAFELLKKNNGAAMDTFRLHTDSIINVMKQLGSNSLTVAVLMDLQDCTFPISLNISTHVDIFDLIFLGFPNSLKQTAEEVAKSPCDLTLTIRALHNSLPKGGRVFWRSSAMFPWYEALYRREGFSVSPIQVREIGSKVARDNVNMYASFWKAVKL